MVSNRAAPARSDFCALVHTFRAYSWHVRNRSVITLRRNIRPRLQGQSGGGGDEVSPNRKSVQCHNLDHNLDLLEREDLFFNVNNFTGPHMLLAPIPLAARSKA